MSDIMSSSLQDTTFMSYDEYIDFLSIPIKDIISATNNFADKNILSHGTSFKVYKGKLLQLGQLINIVVRKCPLDSVTINELIMSKYLKHKNIVSIYKVAETNDNTFLINKLEGNGSLDKHLSGSTLSWMQRLHICVGVARALSYLHYGVDDNCNVIHGNIKSSKVLLDDNWEPKLNGFGFARRVKRHHGYLTSKYNGALQYMDPAYANTKALTYKSDVFSFGVVLFEVLLSKNASIFQVRNEDHWYFARFARLHYDEGTLLDRINPNLRKQMDLKSFNIFSEVAYCCLKEQQGERPAMDQIVKRLETALELQQKHQTPEQVTAAAGDTLSSHLKGRNLDHLKIRLKDIELVTDKFSAEYFIGSGGYGMVYKAELEHFDSTKSSAIEDKNKGEYSKRRSTVAIKRLFSRQDGQVEQGFFAEIEMLTNCKHPNIISLLGFCEEGLERILVYEHASKGSLNDYLGNVDNMTNLTWAQRIQICLDIAHGISYLHSSTEEKQMIIHRDIKSDNILLDDNWVAKIADFGLSKLRPANLQASTLNTCNIAGTTVYLDPEYMKTGKLKKESDIYSFGVVLFEIICGRVAYDEIYSFDNEKGLPSTVRHYFNKGTLQEIIDPKLKETHENIFMLNGGLNQDSLDTFLAIAYQCLASTQAKRPTMKVIIKELEKALYFQKNSKDNLHISLDTIKLATENFSDYKCICKGRYWKQYEGGIPHANANVYTSIVAKRFDSKSDKGNHQFLTELNILLEYKHENIVALVGYCNEMDEKIIVYEHASNGSLDKHLNNGSLTWMKRLKICIDIASGLAFLHSDISATKALSTIHRDIKSASIVLDRDWRAKISNLEVSSIPWEHDELEHVTRSLGYVDPQYKIRGHLTKESDIYSLGIVLVEIWNGRLVWAKGCDMEWESVFEDIKEHSAPESLNTYFEIASACLVNYISIRPDANEVVIQLKKALELQEDYEIWEPKLPADYKEIFLMSKTPEIYLNEKKKDLYEMLTKGIVLQEGKLWFELGVNGERNEMISARKFFFKHHWLRKWKLVPESRFQKVAQMLDISNLNIQIKIKTQLLSPGVNYVVHLVFNFGRPRYAYKAKWIYVNLKYKMGSDDLHSYFATWREDGWMMIELYRFLNHKKDTDFEVLLQSFSLCYCESRVVYIEGVEFRAIDNASLKINSVKYEESKKLKDIQQVFKSCLNLDEVQQSPIDSREILDRFGNNDENKKVVYSLLFDDQLFLSNEVNGKKNLVLSAIGVLYDSSKVKPFHVKLSAESRFQVVVELLPQQVFGIKCKIQTQMLSPNTDYVCYLVFKLSEKCRGLHCPVRVRNLLQWKNKEIGLLCFRSPGRYTWLNDTIWVPKKRDDGWMEVIVWKFNSTSAIRNNRTNMNLKLITYKGTMAGLIVSALELRTM